MGVIKVAPGQNGAVAALLCILALAVGITLYRLRPAQQVSAAVRQPQAMIAVSEGPSQDETIQCPTRNPFLKSRALLMAGTGCSSVGAFRHGVGQIEYGVSPLPGVGQTLLPPANVRVSQPAPAPASVPGAQSQAPAEAQPVFALMATVGTADNSFAVLRINDSQTKVVRVGDNVDGRFKLWAIRPDFAVLTDGKVRVIAKRGRVEDGKTPG